MGGACGDQSCWRGVDFVSDIKDGHVSYSSMWWQKRAGTGTSVGTCRECKSMEASTPDQHNLSLVVGTRGRQKSQGERLDVWLDVVE